jgi:hypothetical protein
MSSSWVSIQTTPQRSVVQLVPNPARDVLGFPLIGGSTSSEAELREYA